ncbi:unnamed protein product [Brassica oleracea]
MYFSIIEECEMLFFSLNALRSYTDLSFSKFITFFLSNIMMMTLAASVSCLSLSRTATVTSCKHEYHLQRVIEWSQRSRECSICWQLFVLKDPARTIYLLASSGSLCQTLIPVTKICGLDAKRLQL